MNTTYYPIAIDLLNKVKAWRDCEGNDGFPSDVREGIDALLMAIELRDRDSNYRCPHSVPTNRIRCESCEQDAGYALLSELVGIDTSDCSLRDTAAAYEALDRYRASLSTSASLCVLDRDHQRLAVFEAIQAIKFGNKWDDKLIVEQLHKAGFVVAAISESKP